MITIKCLNCKVDINKDSSISDFVLETSKKKQRFCSLNCLKVYKEKKINELIGYCINCDKRLFKDKKSAQYIRIENNNHKIYFCNDDCLNNFDIEKCKSNTFIDIKIKSFLKNNFYNNNYPCLPEYAENILNTFYDKYKEPLEVIYTSMQISLKTFEKIESNLEFNSDSSRLNYFLAIVRDKIYQSKVIINKNKTVDNQIKNFNIENTIEGEYIKTEDKALLQKVLKQLL